MPRACSQPCQQKLGITRLSGPFARRFAAAAGSRHERVREDLPHAALNAAHRVLERHVFSINDLCGLPSVCSQASQQKMGITDRSRAIGSRGRTVDFASASRPACVRLADATACIGRMTSFCVNDLAPLRAAFAQTYEQKLGITLQCLARHSVAKMPNWTRCEPCLSRHASAAISAFGSKTYSLFPQLLHKLANKNWG